MASYNAVEEGDLLTVKEVAVRVRVTPHTVKQWIYQGKLRRVKVGRLNLIHRDDLACLVAISGAHLTRTSIAA